MTNVTEIPATLREQWNLFVLSSGGTYVHAWEWGEAIEKSYGWETVRFGMFRNDVLTACLPVTIMNTLLGKKKGISMAFGNYGGIVALPGEDIEKFLRECSDNLKSRGVMDIELRYKTDNPGVSGEVTLVLDLPDGEDVLWKKIGAKTRNLIRKAQTHDLKVEWSKDLLADFHRVYSLNMHRLGTPVHSRRFFECLLLAFGENASILSVIHNSRVIAGMICIRHGEVWADPFASSDPKYSFMNPNMLMYWSALQRTCLEGARKFDFGRSEYNSGTYKFKTQWSAKPYRLDYISYRNGEIRSGGATSFYRSKSGSLLSRIWTKIPYLLHASLGPQIRKYIP